MSKHLTIKEIPKMDRPYEKLEKLGCTMLSDAELLAIIIKTGNKEETAVDLARRILLCNGLEALKKASFEQLVKINGVGRVKAFQMLALKELSIRMSTLDFNENCDFISCPDDVSFLPDGKNEIFKKEVFKILILDNKNKIIKESDISLGSLDQTIVHPRDVFYEAIKNMAKSVILVHNHPSGDPTPSTNDLDTTRRLIKCSELLGISILDHIIIGNGKHTVSKIMESSDIIKLYLTGGNYNGIIWQKDIGIDLGTANTLIYERGKGIVLREPSVVAINERTKEVIAVGSDAKRMIGRTPGTIKAIRPLKDGVIADYHCTLAMLKALIKKATGKFQLGKPRLIICVPAGVTAVERKAVIEAGLEAGAKEVYITEESIMAAVGAGLPVLEPTGNMIVDIGGGTSEVAIISLGSIVNSTTLRSAGDSFDEAISKYIRKKYRIFIGDRTAEELKITIGNVYPSEYPGSMEIRGRNMTQGLPVNLTVNSDEMAEAMEDIVDELYEAIRSTLEKTPPELAADVITNGIVLTGGGALIKGLDKYLYEKTGKINVRIADDPLDCVAKGTGIALDNIDLIKGERRA